MKFEEIKNEGQKYLFQNYGRIDISFTHGEGVYLYDTTGKKYLDLVAGIAVNAIGYSHPEWVARVQDQVGKLIHVSNLYNVEEQVILAEKIASITPGNLNRSLFVNSGAEANEGALKVAVRYTGRSKVASALNGFHGRTAASLGATGQTKYQKSFEPLISHAYHYYEYDDEESLKSIVDKDTAAVMIEPIQGEGGVVVAKPAFYKAVRDVCNDTGAIMIVDEVQTGMGRTGKWFGTQNYNVIPDIITMAKGLGGGVPIGAVVTTNELSSVMTPGTHGTTFGGNPLVCTAGSAVIDIMKKEHILDNVNTVGDAWMKELKAINSPKIKDVRGKGFLIGVEMDSPETAVGIQKYMLDNGILINVCHGKVIRLIPPLILKQEHVAMFMKMFKECL
ncbi:MAG: acetylornithine transaminase [Candidatus Methanogranum gryphiswaldense]|nr:MAG: acetylornithine transaminase [Candidatus Methanogranum sp. U3.2.1]